MIIKQFQNPRIPIFFLFDVLKIFTQDLVFLSEQIVHHFKTQSLRISWTVNSKLLVFGHNASNLDKS